MVCNSQKHQKQEDLETVLSNLSDYYHSLVVWNDDVNTFDWVIKCLVEICDHSPEQAEQCAFFIHFRGKYAVKEDALETLRPMREALTERGLSATIESDHEE